MKILKIFATSLAALGVAAAAGYAGVKLLGKGLKRGGGTEVQA